MTSPVGFNTSAFQKLRHDYYFAKMNETHFQAIIELTKKKFNDLKSKNEKISKIAEAQNKQLCTFTKQWTKSVFQVDSILLNPIHSPQKCTALSGLLFRIQLIRERLIDNVLDLYILANFLSKGSPDRDQIDLEMNAIHEEMTNCAHLHVFEMMAKKSLKLSIRNTCPSLTKEH